MAAQAETLKEVIELAEFVEKYAETTKHFHEGETELVMLTARDIRYIHKALKLAEAIASLVTPE